MLNLDDKKLKCALILGILFFVLSHPYLYRLAHRNLSQFISFLDAEGCPTELGVLVMALVFVGVVYWGHDELSVNKVTNNKKANNGNNVILNKCRTYCQQVSDEMNQENAMMNNIANQNNNQMVNNQVVNNQVANNQMANNVRMNAPAVSNQLPNNIPVNSNALMNNNNVHMNQNRMNNAMMNNQLQNNVQAPMPSVNLNNASNLGMDNLGNNNVGNNDMGLMNAQSCSDNPQCSGNMNSLVGGQAYDPNLSNMNSGGMFSENTTYHDDMYASLF